MQIALDVVLLGVAKAAVRHDCGLACLEPGLTGEVLGGICCGGARETFSVLRCMAVDSRQTGFLPKDIKAA